MTPLNQEQMTAFDKNGFLVVPAVLNSDELSAMRAAMARRVADLLQRYHALGRGEGAIGGKGGFEENLTHLLQAVPEAYQHIDITLPLSNELAAKQAEWEEVFGDDWQAQAGVYTDDSIFSLLTHPTIVAIATQLIGDEVTASPVQHVRMKPPQRKLHGSAAVDSNTARTLWHQDEAVVTEEARGVDILTVWVAVTDATRENGCMEAVPGSHKAADTDAAADFGLTMHCPGKGALAGEIYIPEEAIDRADVVPLVANAGDVVLLHKRTVHGAGANTSNGIRWSFDLRYQATGTPSGRSFYPSTVVASRANPARVVASAEEYRDAWLAARDAILSGATQANFNVRWDKYAPICA